MDDDDLTFDGDVQVTKNGRTTGETFGDLIDDCLSVRIPKTDIKSYGYFAFFKCYGVGNRPNDNFMLPGDSGSAVFVIDNDSTHKPLGVGFALMSTQTAVCRIDTIVHKLDLQIVRYLNNR